MLSLVMRMEAVREARPSQVESSEAERGFSTLPKPVTSFVPLKKRGPRAWDRQSDNPFHDLELQVNKLLVHKVTDSTNNIYAKWVYELIKDVRHHGVPFDSHDERDRAIAAYMSYLCYAGRLSHIHGGHLLSGFVHIFPEHRNELPLFSRALSAWQTFKMTQEGGSFCREVMGLLVADLLERGKVVAACVAFFTFDTFCREQDWAALRVENLAFDGVDLAVVFGDRRKGEEVKTGSNQGLNVGSPTTTALVRGLADGCEPGDVVFPMSVSEYRRQWMISMMRLGLSHLGTPHNMRHTAAGEFVAHGGTLESCRRRGRWSSLSSVQRYTKTYKIVEARASLTPEQLERGLEFWSSPHSAFLRLLESPACSHLVVAAGLKKFLARVDPGTHRGDCVHLSLGNGPQVSGAAMHDFKPVRRRPKR